MKKVILVLIMVLSTVCLKAQNVVGYTEDAVEYTDVKIPVNWENTFEEAISKADAEDKPILIYFTGSDWCGPCKRIDENLFHTEKFTNFSNENLVLYMADFPRNRDLVTKENKKINKQLSKKYNQNSFPTMIMVDKRGNVLGRKDGTYMVDYYYTFFNSVVRDFK